jgi:peptide-methionine (S)-S-oxide reductase
MQGVFEHVEGVTQAVAGYAGGVSANPRYEEVSQGGTGHAEAVEVTFDPRRISLGDVLRIYFSVAHDPTEIDRQGADIGSQYRSEIFAADAAEASFASAYIAELDAAKAFARPIATRVEPLAAFYPAEAYHQHYAARRPADIYVALNDAPKIAALKRAFPGLYREPQTQQMAAK